MKLHHALLSVLIVSNPAACRKGNEGSPPTANGPTGMRWIPPGEFMMGTDDADSMANERPAHKVQVSGLWMDEHPVTNAEFAAFVAATGYVTTAEKPVDWEEMKKEVPPGTPKPPDDMLRPGSIVFTPPGHAVDLSNMANWWTWTTGADWRHHTGRGPAQDPAISSLMMSSRGTGMTRLSPRSSIIRSKALPRVLHSAGAPDRDSSMA